MTRAEHLQWAKDDAMGYVERGDLLNAVTAMMSDMDKHPETKLGPMGVTLMMVGLMSAWNHDGHGVKRWIEGFN